MATMRIWMRATALACLLLMAACAPHGATKVQLAPAGNPDTGTPPPPAIANATTLPSLADLPALGESPSKWVSKTASAINGVDVTSQGGTLNRAEGSALAIIPGSGDELAFAQYTQGGIAFDKPVGVEFSVEPTAIIPGSGDELSVQFWLGMSDFTTFKWKWFGPFDGSSLSSLPHGASMVRKGASSIFSLPINSEEDRERYVSQADITGHCQMSYVVICTSTSDPLRPHAVKINSSSTTVSSTYVTNNPHYVPVFQPNVQESVPPPKGGKRVSAAGPEVDLGWEHIQSLGPDDDRNCAAEYQVWRQGTDETSPVMIGQIEAPESSFSDPPAGGYPPATPPIKTQTPGVQYTYSVRALNAEQGGTPPAPCSPAIMPIAAPSEVRTELTSDDQTLYISWNPVLGAKSYDVLSRFTSDSSGPSFLHTVPSAGLLHVPDHSGEIIYYTIVANGRDRSSQFSDEARGFVPNYPDLRDGGDAVVFNLAAGGPAIRFLRVPDGTVELGSDGTTQRDLDTGEGGRDSGGSEDTYQPVNISQLYVSETEITNAQWKAFMDANGYGRDIDIWTQAGANWRNLHGVTAPPHWNDTPQTYNSGPDPAYADFPVNDISWYEANAYARWVNEKFQSSSIPMAATVSLPNEAQWEYAAEGPTRFSEWRLFPWSEMCDFNGVGGKFNDGGDGLDMLLCNDAEDNPFTAGLTCKVDDHLDGRSWCGAFNMAGNVAEWTSDSWQPTLAFPWAPTPNDGSASFACIRGGRCLDSWQQLRTSSRQGMPVDFAYQPGYTFEGIGVRLIVVGFPNP